MLKREDIESLGFIHKEDRGMEENNGLMFTRLDPRFVKADIVIRYWVSSGSYRLRIERINGCIFEGHVKNKSELKQVLKMIGVEYENTNS